MWSFFSIIIIILQDNYTICTYYVMEQVKVINIYNTFAIWNAWYENDTQWVHSQRWVLSFWDEEGIILKNSLIIGDY